jgi:hypothetical protein
MSMFLYELKKILLTPAIIGVALLCLIFNIVLVCAYYDDTDFQSDSQAVNIFEGFDASNIAEGFVAKYHVTGSNADNIREKYAKLQPVIDEKATNGDALSNYFREQTYYRHGLLFGTMFLAIIAESCLLALFAALVSVTYENTRNTEHIVCASKVGRHIVRSKLCASLTAAVCFTAIILVLTLGTFFAKFDFSGVWGDNVSSAFNFAAYSYAIPFITWHSFTVAGYLWAAIGALFSLAICFCLMGYAIGVLAKNSYVAFIGSILAVALPFIVKPLFSIGSITLSALNLAPTNLWLNSAEWFTDGNAGILWANFECIGLSVSFTALALVSFAAAKIFGKRELL